MDKEIIAILRLTFLLNWPYGEISQNTENPLSYDVASKNGKTSYNEIYKPLVVYRFSGTCNAMKWCLYVKYRCFLTKNTTTKLVLKSYHKYNLNIHAPVLLNYYTR